MGKWIEWSAFFHKKTRSVPRSGHLSFAILRNLGDDGEILTFKRVCLIRIAYQEKYSMDAPGALHHVIIRGIERKVIFKDSQVRVGIAKDHILTRASPPYCQVEQDGRAGTKKYLPPRRKAMKDFILLFFLRLPC